jgi:thiol-disulfide isomerase/thioredoxin
MQSELGVPTALELQRKQETLEVELVPGAFPLELPALPGPPKVGTTAPTLELDAVYRGAKPDGSKPALLFFWATWCGPCKQSVPELMRFAEQRGVHVVAITDEEPAQLDGFFEKHTEPFPETVVSDPLRIAFQTYGVSGTPTFVLIDPAGVIQTYQRGYSSDRGLEFEGWSH